MLCLSLLGFVWFSGPPYARSGSRRTSLAGAICQETQTAVRVKQVEALAARGPVAEAGGEGVIAGLFLETLARTAPLTHGSMLPHDLTSGLISHNDRRVLEFVLSFWRSSDWRPRC